MILTAEREHPGNTRPFLLHSDGISPAIEKLTHMTSCNAGALEPWPSLLSKQFVIQRDLACMVARGLPAAPLTIDLKPSHGISLHLVISA